MGGWVVWVGNRLAKRGYGYMKGNEEWVRDRHASLRFDMVRVVRVVVVRVGG